MLAYTGFIWIYLPVLEIQRLHWSGLLKVKG